jgi:hypothetical protein
MTPSQEFKKYASTYKLLEHVGKVVLYSLSRGERLLGFEVMVMQHRQAAVLGGRELTGGDSLPSTSSWGQFGWSYLSTQQESAKSRFERACKTYNVRRLVRR